MLFKTELTVKSAVTLPGPEPENCWVRISMWKVFITWSHVFVFMQTLFTSSQMVVQNHKLWHYFWTSFYKLKCFRAFLSHSHQSSSLHADWHKLVWFPPNRFGHISWDTVTNYRRKHCWLSGRTECDYSNRSQKIYFHVDFFSCVEAWRQISDA